MAAVDCIDDEKPDGHCGSADAAGNETFAQDAIQIHRRSIYRRRECVLD